MTQLYVFVIWFWPKIICMGRSQPYCTYQCACLEKHFFMGSIWCQIILIVICTFSSTIHHLWFLVSNTLLANNLNEVPRGFKVSRVLIGNMIIFINISNFLKWEIIYIMTFSVARWDTRDDSFFILVSKGKILLSILMPNVIRVHL